MLRSCRIAFSSPSSLWSAPQAGYEIASLPHEKLLREYLDYHQHRLVLTILADEKDSLCQGLLRALAHINLGFPGHVRLATVPIMEARDVIERERVLAVPTTLFYWKGSVVERTVGVRPLEIGTKSRMWLRSHNLSITADGSPEEFRAAKIMEKAASIKNSRTALSWRMLNVRGPEQNKKSVRPTLHK